MSDFISSHEIKNGWELMGTLALWLTLRVDLWHCDFISGYVFVSTYDFICGDFMVSTDFMSIYEFIRNFRLMGSFDYLLL